MRGWFESALLTALFFTVWFFIPIWLVAKFEERKLFSGNDSWIFLLIVLAIPIGGSLILMNLFDIN